jgi:undecaprenyl diphosphate synthase
MRSTAGEQPGKIHHLALIPDGNRRWARGLGLSDTEGHRAGIARVAPLVSAAWAQGVSVVSVWWGSPANLVRRHPTEVQGIIGSLAEFLEGDAPHLLATHGAGFSLVGRWQHYCPGLAAGASACMVASGVSDRHLCMLMAYDGREELLAAATGFVGGTLGDLESRMWTAHLPPVDLMVRTGGEPHLSAAFMAWKAADAMFESVDTLWPDFQEEHLLGILTRRSRAQRRFGA